MSAEIVTCPDCGRKNRVASAGTGIPRCGQCGTSLPWIAEADDRSYAEVVQQATLPVLVDFWAPWCGPCRMVSPALENLARRYAGRIKLVKINVDASPSVSQRFAVQGIPTLLVLFRGQVLARRTGAAPEAELRTWLDEVLATKEATGSPVRQ